MQTQFIGFNTAVVKYEDRFLALMLKIKHQNQQCQNFYLQAQVLNDLIMILQNRIAIVLQRLVDNGENYKSALISFNEQLLKNIPSVEVEEIQQPNPERRIMSITLKPGDNYSTLILVMQNEQIVSLRIDDMQVEALLVGIQQSLKLSNDQQIIDYVSSNTGFMQLYVVNLTNKQNMQYQQYLQDQWKLDLFNHYLGVLFCCDGENGRNIISGAVIKTSAHHHSAEENNIVLRLLANNPELKELHDKAMPCQIFTKIIPSLPARMLTMEECLRPLHAFYLEMQATLEA